MSSQEQRTSFRVEYDGHEENLGGSDPNDRWSRDSTSTTWNVHGLVLGEDHHGLCLDGLVRPGDTVWLVYAVWSDGDSFGHDEGARIDFITVHREEAIARANAEMLVKATNRDHGYGYKVRLLLDNNTILPYTVPWLGYFESLDYVRCEPFKVGQTENGGTTYRPR